MKMKKILSAALALGFALSSSALSSSVFADSKESISIFAVYSDHNDGNISYWNGDDNIQPAVDVLSDGEYTVELDFPEGTAVDMVGHLGIKVKGAEDKQLNMNLVSLTYDGNDYPIDGIEYEFDGLDDFTVFHNEGNEDICPDFVGASKITITVDITGVGEAGSENGEFVGDESENDGEKPEEDSKSKENAGGPTLAFDSDDWSDYIDVFDDTENNSYSLKSEKDVVYQGASMKLTADLKSVPDYSTDSETAMGIVLKAEDFGIEKFDGYTLNFFSRFNVNVEGMLFDDSLYVFGENNDGEVTTATTKKIIYSATSNVNNYEKQFFTVSKDTDTTSIVLKVPIMEKYSGDVLYIDNLTLMDSDSNSIATLDTYNSNAKITDQGDVIKQNKKQITVDTDKVEKQSEKISPVIIVLIVVVAVVIVALTVFIIIKNKKRFY